jgi:hypothetical protein
MQLVIVIIFFSHTNCSNHAHFTVFLIHFKNIGGDDDDDGDDDDNDNGSGSAVKQ